jgi:fibronectin-binding autotransporter adhesin
MRSCLGAVLRATPVVGSGGFAEVYGQVSRTLVKSGGEEDVFVGGGAIWSTVQKGGVQEVFAEESAVAVVGTVVAGTQIVAMGGNPDQTSVISGGVLIVGRFGVARNPTVSKGGIAEVSGESFVATILGGEEVVLAGGLDLGSMIAGGGKVLVSSGGTAFITMVSSGGQLIISSGGTASRVAVSSGGELVINRFGSASGTVVSNGGIEIVGFGGRATGTALLSGARETISSGGIDSAAQVDSGSLETALSGGVARGAVISGGTLDIKSGVSTNTTTFATSGGGTLLLESSLTFSGLVAGFGQPDRLDFRDIGFTSGVTSATWTQSGARGTLAVTDGTHTADITLLGLRHRRLPCVHRRSRRHDRYRSARQNEHGCAERRAREPAPDLVRLRRDGFKSAPPSARR